MTVGRLNWDKSGERLYETGTKNCVLYPFTKPAEGETTGYKPGVAWNGITAITESPSGADAENLYADDMKYLTLRAAEEFGGTIEAYMYPDEWMACDGSAEAEDGVVLGQQSRKTFGLCFRTVIGNDEELDKHGYKLHLIYGATASPSERAYATINDSPEAITFSWEFETVPVECSGYKNVSCITIDSTKVDPTALAALEDELYGKNAGTGSTGIEPHLPMPDDVLDFFS